MIRANKNLSIKHMLSQLLESRKELKARAPSKKSKGKWKEGESSSSMHIEEEKHLTLSRPSLRLKREAIQRMGALILKG